MNTQRIDSLQTELYKAQGGNEMLLAAQNQFQNRLIELDQQRRQISGNLSATEERLREQINDLIQDKAKLTRLANNLKVSYRAVVDSFTEELRVIGDKISQDSLLAARVDVRLQAGSLQLIVQEESLFARRTHNSLLPDHQAILQAIVDVLHAYPLLDLQIIGHTDNTKPARNQPANRTFAGLRAATLANELTENYYLSASRVMAGSQGDGVPLKSNETEAGRRANRRLEFRINNSLSAFLRKLEQLN